MKLARIANCVVALFISQLIFVSVAWAGIISTKQEIAIGGDVAKQIEQHYKLVDDSALQKRISKIGNSIVSVCDRRNLPYTFKVLDVDEVNAMAAPGGYIYLFKGLVDLMQTDDELAGIIAHEVGHVVKRHSMGQLEKNIGMTILMGAAFGEKGLPLQMAAISAISAGYSRDDERQADKLGYELSVKAGYSQYGMMIGLMKLSELNPNYKNSLFSDHPETAARIKLIKKYLQENNVKVSAQETSDGKMAKVIDDKWFLPEFKVFQNNNKPLYRAYLVAGKLHNIDKIKDYSIDKYILDSDGTQITIYYDEQEIVTLTPEDAMAANVTLDELVQKYLASLKTWKKN